MGSNQSKPARDPETALYENESPLVTLPEDYGSKKRKTKHTWNSSSEIVLTDATEAAIQRTNMEAKNTSAYSSVVLDPSDKAKTKRGGRNQAKRLQRHSCENEMIWKEHKHAKNKSSEIESNVINTDNVNTMQNCEAVSKARPESIVNTCSMNGYCTEDSDVRIKKSETEMASPVNGIRLLTNGIYTFDEPDCKQDSIMDSNICIKNETTIIVIPQNNDPLANDKITKQGSPVCYEASNVDDLSKHYSICTTTEMTSFNLTTTDASSSKSVSRQGRPVCHAAGKDSALTDETVKRSDSSLFSTALSKDSQSEESSPCFDSGIEATTLGNHPNPTLNSTHLSSSASDFPNTTTTSSILSNSQYSTLTTPTQPTTELVSTAATNSYPPKDTSQLLFAPSSYACSNFSRSMESCSSTRTSIATTHTSSGIADIYSQPVSSSQQSFSFSGNSHGSISYSGNNHGNFSFSGNNHGNFSMSTNAITTLVPSTHNGSPVTTSASNYNFPPTLTNYLRRDTQTNYNSDYMYATTISDSLGLTGSSTNGYPNWNALQTGIETDGAQVLINEAHLLNDERLARQLQNLLSTYNGNDYNTYDEYGTGYIGNDNSAASRGDSNKSDLEGDYITVRTSVGDTTTRISAKNIKLSPQYRDGLTDENMGIILERPKYPRYATLASRIKSFEDSWPVTNQMSWEQLPEAGFVYTGTADCVRCYYCNGGLREWLKNDCAWTEHARYYPHCPHVRCCKGDEFIRTVRQGTDDAAYTHEEESDNDMEVDAEAEGNNTLPRDLEATKVAAEIITDQGLLDKAVYYLKTIQGKASFDAQELAGVAFEIEEGKIKVDSFQNTTDVTEVIEEPSQTNDNDRIDDLEIDPVMLEEETRLLKERSLCKVCLDATACVLFLECGHMIACPMCAPALKNCAVCRAEIKGTVRAQFATDR